MLRKTTARRSLVVCQGDAVIQMRVEIQTQSSVVPESQEPGDKKGNVYSKQSNTGQCINIDLQCKGKKGEKEDWKDIFF